MSTAELLERESRTVRARVDRITRTAVVDLDSATRLDGADGNYRITLSPSWNAWGPNGGYLAAIALRAAGKLAHIPRPASLYCHFLSSPKFAEVELAVELVKQGRRSESLSVQMRQEGRPVLQALVRTAAAAPGYEHQHVSMPVVPPPDELLPYDELEDERAERRRYNFWKNIEARPTQQNVRERSWRAVVRDWVRFRPQPTFDDEFVDAARSVILLDAYGWLSAWAAYRGDRYIAPNLDTSVWFHDFRPQSEWLLIDHACPIANDGLLGVQGQVWDRQGRLLATGSAQLCCLPVESGS
jgi:acyl-CoA thioesterase II